MAAKTVYQRITSQDKVPDDEGPDPFKKGGVSSFGGETSNRTRLSSLPTYRPHYDLPSPPLPPKPQGKKSKLKSLKGSTNTNPNPNQQPEKQKVPEDPQPKVSSHVPNNDSDPDPDNPPDPTPEQHKSKSKSNLKLDPSTKAVGTSNSKNNGEIPSLSSSPRPSINPSEKRRELAEKRKKNISSVAQDLGSEQSTPDIKALDARDKNLSNAATKGSKFTRRLTAMTGAALSSIKPFPEDESIISSAQMSTGPPETNFSDAREPSYILPSPNKLPAKYQIAMDRADAVAGVVVADPTKKKRCSKKEDPNKPKRASISRNAEIDNKIIIASTEPEPPKAPKKCRRPTITDPIPTPLPTEQQPTSKVKTIKNITTRKQLIKGGPSKRRRPTITDNGTTLHAEQQPESKDDQNPTFELKPQIRNKILKQSIIHSRSPTPRPFEPRPRRPTEQQQEGQNHINTQSVSIEIQQSLDAINVDNEGAPLLGAEKLPSALPPLPTQTQVWKNTKFDYEAAKSRIYMPHEEVKFPYKISNSKFAGRVDNQNYAYGPQGFYARDTIDEGDNFPNRIPSIKSAPKTKQEEPPGGATNIKSTVAERRGKSRNTSIIIPQENPHIHPSQPQPKSKKIFQINEEKQPSFHSNQRQQSFENPSQLPETLPPVPVPISKAYSMQIKKDSPLGQHQHDEDEHLNSDLIINSESLNKINQNQYRNRRGGIVVPDNDSNLENKHRHNSKINVVSQNPLPTHYPTPRDSYYRAKTEIQSKAKTNYDDDKPNYRSATGTGGNEAIKKRRLALVNGKEVFPDYLSRSNMRQDLRSEGSTCYLDDELNNYYNDANDDDVANRKQRGTEVSVLSGKETSADDPLRRGGSRREDLNSKASTRYEPIIVQGILKQQAPPYPASSGKISAHETVKKGQAIPRRVSIRPISNRQRKAPLNVLYIGLGSQFWDVENSPEITWYDPLVIKDRKFQHIYFSDIPDADVIPSFRYPLYVQEVHFDGQITQDNFLNVLRNLQELRALEIHVSTLHHLNLDISSAKKSMNFPSLKSLEISCSSFDEEDAMSYNLNRITKNTIIILSLYYPAITYLGLAIPFVAVGEKKLMSTLWSFILDHRETLQIFNIECPFPEPVPTSSTTISKTLTLIDPEVLEMNLKGANQVKLVSFHLFYWHQVGSTEFWRRFVKTQDKLEYIQFWVEGPVYYKFPYDVIKSNYYQLVTVSMNLDIRSFPDRHSKVPIDLNAFAESGFLKTIALKGIELDHVSPKAVFKPDVVNVESLPKSVEIIKLMNLSLSSDDVAKIALTLPRLRVLYLENGGTQENLGVTVDTLVLLLEKERNFLEQVEIFNSINTESLQDAENNTKQKIKSNSKSNSNSNVYLLGFRLIARLLWRKQDNPSFRAYRATNYDFEIIYEDDGSFYKNSNSRRNSNQYVNDEIDAEIERNASVYGTGTKKIISSFIQSSHRPVEELEKPENGEIDDPTSSQLSACGASEIEKMTKTKLHLSANRTSAIPIEV